MGGAGTDMALMSDDLAKLSLAAGLGRATGAIIVQNPVISMRVIAFLIATSLLGVVVVLNVLRLLSYQAKG